MRHTHIARLVAAACLTTLCGCGQMGPLYMPQEEKTTSSAPAAQPAQPQQTADKP